ncbi:MAG TPA: PSD1 and planctomycete cytochrome C domain-containing protein [Pirellulaceae bacterium]|nr:PSD1 and planctomycete cytochrome C domain-containing protein [Pirellulaceae bacterium]
MRESIGLGFVCVLLVVGACAADDRVSYTQHVQPLLSRRCYACHGPDEQTREGGLAMHRRELLLAEADSGDRAVVPGRPQRSSLIERISSDDPFERMPPPGHGPPLTEIEIDLLRRWIEQGAEFEGHWAYQPIRQPELPSVHLVDWPKHAIDYFVLEKLEHLGLTPAEPASRETWMRRVYLDLVGLPPTLDEQLAYLSDSSANADERLVDRLLASPAYGEHAARMWLDLARYADSQGYAQDELRSIWPYRDWVIDALNADMPFDQFTIEQLAGDLLPNPTREQLIATGFHRNTMTNTEGGTDDEEFRHAAIVDRVNTTGTVWLGTTLACAQCHTHKYDPITHEDYYRLYAIFNQTADNDQPDNSPTLEIWSEADLAEREGLQQRLAELEGLVQDGENQDTRTAEMAAIRERLGQLRPVTTPIMRELTGQARRATHICIGGAHHSLGPPVEPGVPVVWQYSEMSPTNRLEFARWLMGDDHPLVARVAVNRHWEQFFGQGLVKSNHDFGTQGDLPSHPELLDWMAVEFRRGGWSWKQLTKQIVLSATYRQSSRVTTEKLARDPSNQWLSRGPRFRLSAEQIRDYALGASGLLSSKMHGPPVRPPQPRSGLNAAFGGSLDWDPSPGEDRYRRGIYTQLRRVYPYPSFMALDATNRTICTAQRVPTNTPVAAFVTLNDPAFVECAQALAGRIVSTVADDFDERAINMFQMIVCRKPDSSELDAIRELHAMAQQMFASDPLSATHLAGQSGDETNVNWVEVAAWTVIANTLFNLDEVLTKN